MKKKLNRYYVEQKICGILIFLVGLLALIVSEDGTAGILLIPCGLFMAFTKKKLIYDRSKRDK